MPPAPPLPPPKLLPLHTHSTEPTTNYWQSFLPPTSAPPQPPFRFSYPATLPDGRILLLPIRPLPIARAVVAGDTATPLGDEDPDTSKVEKGPEPRRRALASLLVNHASFPVVEDLSSILAHRISHFLSHDSSLSAAAAPDVARSFADLSTIVVGVPTLGLTVAPLVAKALGATRYVPLGYSRKFWYEDALSAGVESITSPRAVVEGAVSPGAASRTLAMSKRAFLDPNLLVLLRGKGVVLIDDVISSGRTLNAVWDFLEDETVGCSVLAVAVLMLQGGAWRKLVGVERAGKVIGVLDSPLLRAMDGKWVVE